MKELFNTKRIVIRKISAAFLAASMLLLAACGSVNNGSISKPESEEIAQFLIGTSTQIEKAVRDEYNYDMLASGTSEICVVAKNADGSFSPLLASYETEDSLTWKYKIMDGLCWSDGNKVTAEDLLFSIEYEGKEQLFTEGENKGKYKSYEISADNTTLTLVLETANVKELDEMAVLRIRPKHIYDGKTPDDLTDSEKRISCGPYILETFDKNAGTICFIRNENYPKKAKAERIIYKLFANEDVLYQSLIQGDIDMVWNYAQGVPENYQDVLASNSNVKLDTFTASNCPAMLVFNNSNGLFADQNLREAVAMALDYEAFKTYFASANAKTPSRSFAPESLTGYKDTETLKTDLSKAAEYMTKAGYVKNGSVYEKDGKAAEFTLTVNSSKAAHLGYAEYVKNQLEAFGIKVNIDSLDKTHYNERTSHKFAREGEHSYGKITMEAAIMGYTAYGMSDFGGMYINGNDKTQGGAEVYDAKLDAAMDALNMAGTLEEYCRAAGQIQDYYAENIPAVALYWDSLVYAHNSAVSGLAIDSNFGLNNINNWFLIRK